MIQYRKEGELYEALLYEELSMLDVEKMEGEGGCEVLKKRSTTSRQIAACNSLPYQLSSNAKAPQDR
jgi:hypothetical protein